MRSGFGMRGWESNSGIKSTKENENYTDEEGIKIIQWSMRGRTNRKKGWTGNT